MKVLEPSLTDEELDRLERDTFKYFADEVNLENGLVPDNTRRGAPSFDCRRRVCAYCLSDRGRAKYMSRAEAIKRTLTTLRFFHEAPQGTEQDATGYEGFYYHFLDMKTGRRAGTAKYRQSTRPTCSRARSPRVYFNRETKSEREIRTLAESLYKRADWHWAQNGASPSRMVGDRREDSSSIAGPDTAKR